MSDRPFLTINEFAELVGVTPTTVYKMCRVGKIPYIRVGLGRKGNIRIHRDVVKLLTERALSHREPNIGGGGYGNAAVLAKRTQLPLFPDDDAE